jgi:diguanylate cyclase
MILPMQAQTTTRAVTPWIQNLTVLTVLFALVQQIWSLITFYDIADSALVEGAIRVLPMFFAGLAVASISRQHPNRASLPWRYLALALALNTIGTLLYQLFKNVFNVTAFPSIADIFLSLTPAMMVYGFFRLPHVNLKRLEGLRAVLDASIIVMTISGFIWFFVLSPAILAHYAKSNGLSFEVSLAMTYPIYDLLALALLITNVARWERSSLGTEIRWLMLGLVGWLVADGYFLARCFFPPLPESHPLESGWAWGALMIVIAARGSLFKSSKTQLQAQTNTLLVRYGAYLAILLIFPLLLFSQGFAPLQRIGTEIITGLIFLAVIARQIVLTMNLEHSNAQLQKLSSELEARVAARTADLEFQTLHDALTGLPNRVFNERHLNRMLELQHTSNLCVAVLYIDLDHFKDINDTLGHPIGDEVLKRVTERFQACVSTNGFLARLGGDEFSLVISSLEPSSAIKQTQAVAERLIQSLSSALRVGDADFFLGASVGISLAPNDGLDATSLQKHADSAMYRAKREGVGWRLYSPDIDANTTLRLETERALRRALETDPGNSFQVYYQPILEIQTGQIVALEALVRWNDDHVLRSPDQFIPIAEECGLIVPLGTWILQEACKQLVRWAEYDLRVSVNVSTAQFERPDFVGIVQHTLESTKLPPERLSLELLESVLVSRFDETASKISQLRATGVRLALDDFGSGYSSLSYLNRLTFDTLKLDRSFVHALGSSRDTRALVAAIVSIAGEFGMDTIAEGVETNAQLETLTALGCDKVQGWLYAPAMSAIELESFLKRGNLEAREFTPS